MTESTPKSSGDEPAENATPQSGGGASGATPNATDDTSGRKRKADQHKYLRKVPFLGDRIADRLEDAPVVPVLSLNGVIGESGRLRKGGLTLADLARPIDQAFEFPKARAVALIINSPGGSPVQSALIAQRIRLMAEEAELPVIAFCEDAAASGGYWLACAADEIYAADASVVGSIGVISAGFGFTELISKIGVERRVYTAGTSKSQLDPFKPENPEDIARLIDLQKDIHDQFSDWVRERRGARLKGDDEALFSGEFWTGRKALELGLVDGLGEIRTLCRAKFGNDVKLPLVTEPKGWLQRSLGLGSRMGTRIGSGMGPSEGISAGVSAGVAQGVEQGVERAFDAVSDRAYWARLGL